MDSSKVTTSGLFLDDSGPSAIEQGTGWVIGDGVTLTAGHVVFEYNRSLTNPLILDGSNSIFLDFEGYQARYLAAVQTRIAAGTLDGDMPNTKIEGSIIARDSVAISQGGNVDKDNAGLAVFLTPGDLTSIGSILNSVVIKRYGNTTGTVTGTVTSVAANGLFRFSEGSDVGDSGGAYVLLSSATSKGFVFGSQAAQPGVDGVPDLSQDAYATWLSASDIAALMAQFETSQSGDVTTREPTNLVVGTSGDDGATGGYRADIMLGRGGGDTLNDGDGASDLVYANDLLFGGGGDDVLVAGKGHDLVHGGDSLDYSASGERNTLEEDGKDKIDYGTIITRGASDKGLTILVAPSSTTGVPAWTYGDETQRANAIYVLDQASGASDYIGSDTLISIEEVAGTGADDTLDLQVAAGAFDQFAGADGKGGLAKVDLKGNATGDGKGDLIDASKTKLNWKIDLSATTNNVVDSDHADKLVLTVLGAERVKTGEGKDVIIGDDQNNEFDGGKGDDRFTGGKGDDKINGGEGEDTAIFSGECHDYEFLVSGSGAERTVTVVHARGDKTDGSDVLTNVEWAEFANGDKVDLTVEQPGCKGQDIAFVIDTTGSMWDDIASVQASASAVIEALFDPARGYADSRVAVIAFNDPSTSVVLGFTDQEDIEARKAAALAAINSLSADGGGDFPELTYTGLLKALDGSIGTWREDAVSRKIVLFGDATSKDSALAGQVYALAANVNAEVGMASAVEGLTMMTVNMAETDPATGETHVVPVQIYTVAIGGYYGTVAEFADIAAQTGGLAFQAAGAADLVEALLEIINLPVYNIRVDSASVEEGDDGFQTVTITITRDNAESAATVKLSRFGAADGDDVSGLPGSVTFAVGERFKTIELRVNGDEIAEGNETFGVSIASISQDASFTNRSASFVIEDDDQPPAVLVLDHTGMRFADGPHFPFLAYADSGGYSALVHQIPFKAIADPAGQLPFSISARDSADGKEMVDIAVMTPDGVAILDGDDHPGNGRKQGIDGDEALVISIDGDAAFDFASAATIRIAGAGAGAASALFYRDGVAVGSASVDAAGVIQWSTDVGGFDEIVVRAEGEASFTIAGIDVDGLYAIQQIGEAAGDFTAMLPDHHALTLDTAVGGDYFFA